VDLASVVVALVVDEQRGVGHLRRPDFRPKVFRGQVRKRSRTDSMPISPISGRVIFDENNGQVANVA
jgi:hypothetical protein